MPDNDNDRLKAVQGALSARSDRRKLFPAHLFADPAWDILLLIYAAALEDRECGMDSLADAGLSTEPLLRWVDVLKGEGFLTTAESFPGSFRLTISGLSRMEAYFATPMDTSHLQGI